MFATSNVLDPESKLLKAIEITTQTIEEDYDFSHVNEIKLNRIIINENSKSYLTKEVDSENKEGYFVVYKRLIARLREMILDINKDFKYATSISSTIVEGALHQHFLKEHFPSITDCNEKVTPTDFYKNLVFNAIKK